MTNNYNYINVSETLLNKWISEEKAYIGEDGQVYCKQCNNCLTNKAGIFYFLRECRKCDVFTKDKKPEEDIDEWFKQQKIKEKKKLCFPTKKAMKSTFEKGNLNSEGSFDVIKYCQNFKEYRKKGMGLLLYGDVGVGKTYLANAIAHRLIETEYTCLSTNFSRLFDESWEYRNKQAFIDSLRKYHLIVIDDLGTERKSPQMTEFAYKVVDTLYGNEVPVVYTTNLSLSTMKNQAEGMDNDLSRIYSRIINTTIPVEIKCKKGQVYEENLTQRENEKFNINLVWQGKTKK